MRLLVQHRSTWAYPSPAVLGPHHIRLRPASHCAVTIDHYRLAADPAGALHWQQDPVGNHVARLTYPSGTATRTLAIAVEFQCDVHAVNPFDFLVDAECDTAPFEYPADLRDEVAPYLDRTHANVRGGALLDAFLATLPHDGDTVQLIVALNAAVTRHTRYITREEPGIWTPEETLAAGCGSCRDSAVLLIAALRSRGLAARFASGYLIQLAHETLVPGDPHRALADNVALHAWAEVYLPGAGWIGLDATSGLLCGEGHIPLACTAAPTRAAPVDGTSDIAATSVAFAMFVERLEPATFAPH